MLRMPYISSLIYTNKYTGSSDTPRPSSYLLYIYQVNDVLVVLFVVTGTSYLVSLYFGLLCMMGGAVVIVNRTCTASQVPKGSYNAGDCKI